MSEEINAKKEEARRRILGLVADYCETYHNQRAPFQEGQRIPYASRVYDSREMVNLVDSALEFWLTSGRYTEPHPAGGRGDHRGGRISDHGNAHDPVRGGSGLCGCDDPAV